MKIFKPKLPPAMVGANWWLHPQDSVNRLSGNKLSGLNTDEALQRLAQYGHNSFSSRHRLALWLQFLSRFKNPLVLLLLVASAISALTGELTNFVIISALVLFSVTLDFVQEHRAGQAAEKLRLAVALKAKVIRDGLELSLPVAEVVPGDLILLTAGDRVPADGLLLEAHDLFVNQTLLTGESYPVEKSPHMALAADAALQDAHNAVFMGSTVVAGNARMLVVCTGNATAMGAIAESLNRAPPPNAFELGAHQFGLLIMRLTVLLVLFVLLINAWQGRPWLESFLFAVALAVGLTPELLPMVVSVTLARGALHMATKKVIVKRLPAIQDLGSMDILCTDKTGTLTEARIHLEKHLDPLGIQSPRVLELAYLNSYFETGIKSPLDEAILAHSHIDSAAWRKIDEVPFDFDRRRVSVLLEKDQQRQLIVKGAAEEILALCKQYESAGSESLQAIDTLLRERMHQQHAALEQEGFRVLGIARRAVALDHDHAVVNDEVALVFVGFAAFLDPPKQSAGPAIAALRGAGVSVKIVTGDSEGVSRHVCKVLDLEVTGVMTGQDIAALDDQALRLRITEVNLFCRVNPGQKERVIRAFKANGHVVGYLGDGINDAPSLHAADVGLSVESAVDVAKDAAAMILLDQDLQVLHEGVLEGRRTFGNIMKYILMGTSSNFGNMFSMAGAALFLPFLPMLPTQILLNNILYDISEVPIPLDQVDTAELQKPRVLDIQLIRNFMWMLGPISSAFDFLTFYLMLQVFNADEALFHTGWFVESLCTQVLVIFVIRTRGNPFKSRAHPILALTSLAVVLLASVLPFTPLGRYLGFVAPPAAFYILLLVLVMVYLILVEWVKKAFYRYVHPYD